MRGNPPPPTAFLKISPPSNSNAPFTKSTDISVFLYFFSAFVSYSGCNRTAGIAIKAFLIPISFTVPPVNPVTFLNFVVLLTLILGSSKRPLVSVITSMSSNFGKNCSSNPCCPTIDVSCPGKDVRFVTSNCGSLFPKTSPKLTPSP